MTQPVKVVEVPDQTKPGDADRDTAFAQRLERIEALLEVLVKRHTVKDWYTVAEVAEILGKAEFTVREWCRLGRVRTGKRKCGRGRSQEWIISHDELLRIQNEGLLPPPEPNWRQR